MYEIELDPEVVESVRMISKQLEEMSQKMVKFAQDITVQISPVTEQLNYTMQAIQDTIPNIRCFQESFRLEMLEFAKNMTSMMQTLDFPVIQPEITREQLKDRLENMSHAELETVKASAVAVVNSVPEKEIHRPSVKKVLKIAFTVILTAISVTDSVCSIADHFAGSKDEVAISIAGNGNHVIVNVYNGSTPKIDYYFEDKQASKETEEDTLKEQNSSVAIATPNTKCDNN
ncbi:hypothetical protein [uncultured Ruminococcus sp.]|uniref:hypothetical protein n=1 Tax=uncultured Ruminococcus sp. TaxID=165186 RepID=UPI0025EC2D8D|nr:hypothetical protein [uncultured Ruminococcus sp.]